MQVMGNKTELALLHPCLSSSVKLYLSDTESIVGLYLLMNVVSCHPRVKKTRCPLLFFGREKTFLIHAVFVLGSCKNNPKSQAHNCVLH